MNYYWTNSQITSKTLLLKRSDILDMFLVYRKPYLIYIAEIDKWIA